MPKRGPGTQELINLEVASVSYTWSWGAQPAQGELVYYPRPNLPQIVSGAWLELTVPGGPVVDEVPKPVFYGVMTGGSLMDTTGQVIPTTRSSGGNEIRVSFMDTRFYLRWDAVYGCFNKTEIRMINGRRVKRYWHILPKDYGRHFKTFTDGPLSAAQILNWIFSSPDVETLWGRIYHPDMFQFPVYDIDAMSGRKLDELVQEVSDRLGLVFTLLPTTTNNLPQPFNLLWARKGEGPAVNIPSNSDNVELGYELSGGPTRANVVGDRNRYLILNLGLEPDWNRSWEGVWDVDLLADDLFNRLTEFNAISGDEEQVQGRQLAAARAREITVREYAALRTDQDFTDYRRFGTRLRMDMPAALYLRWIVFRAFRPPAFIPIKGEQVPVAAINVVEELCAGVNFDPETGKMEAVLDPDENTLATAGGNGFAVVQGYQVGTELLRAIRPDRFNLDRFTQGQSGWKPMSFQVDDSGSDAGNFVLFDEPIIQVDGLIKIVDGQAVLVAAPSFQIPKVLACLTFEADRFFYRFPPGLKGGKDEVLPVPGLRAEVVIDAGDASIDPIEIPYADGFTATAKAAAVADVMLRQQFVFLRGSFTQKLRETDIVPQLTGMLDRVTLEYGPGGRTARVELTGERPVRAKELERAYDRRIQLEPVLPGQKELREQANQMRIAAAAFRQAPGIARQIGAMLHGRLGGRSDLNPLIIEDGPEGETLPVGTPLWKPATAASVTVDPDGNSITTNTGTRAVMPSASAADTPHFMGVTVRDGEKADGTIRVQQHGEVLARVMGPVAVNDTVGRADGLDYLKKVDDGIGEVGKVMQAIGAAEVKLVTVLIGTGGGGGTKTAIGVWG